MIHKIEIVCLVIICLCMLGVILTFALGLLERKYPHNQRLRGFNDWYFRANRRSNH